MDEGSPGFLRWRLRVAPFFLMLAMLLALSACAVKFISDYDEATDKAVTQLQRDFETFFVTVESQPDAPDCEYANHTAFYQQAKIDLSAVEVRARALPKNDITVEQLKLLHDSAGTMESLHKLACLSPEQVKDLRGSFNALFTAILRLELAKKRPQ